MAGHAAGDRVDGVADGDAAGLEQLGELADGVLGLGHREAVARHDDDGLGVGELDGGVVDADLADRAALGPDRSRPSPRRRRSRRR